MFKVHVSESGSLGTHLLMNTLAHKFAGYVSGALFICVPQ